MNTVVQSITQDIVREHNDAYYPTHEGVFVGDLHDRVARKICRLSDGDFSEEIAFTIQHMIRTGKLFAKEITLKNPENEEQNTTVKIYALTKELIDSPFYE